MGGSGVGVRVAVALCVLAASVGMAWANAGVESRPPGNGTGPLSAPQCETRRAPGIRVVSLRWHEVGGYFTITLFVIIAGFAKLVFHHLHWLSNKVPESCVLVILGLAMGLIVYFTTNRTTTQTPNNCEVVPLPQFSSDMFFFILLPPIVLDAAYSLHDRAFFDNLGTVLVYAVIGTLINMAAIGPTLYGLNMIGAMGPMNFTFTEGLVFSSLISAVDPVAVLTIFQELGVHKDLYFLIFGESLLNDGMTVVMYTTMTNFMMMEEVFGYQYVVAVVAFVVVVFGGMLIGVAFGCITALVTKVTTDLRVVEPLALLGLSYLSYLTAELFHFSGIISLITCGLIQAHYALQNISQKSYTCVKYFTKMASATSDTIIFMFLGMVLVSDRHQWHTGFVMWSVFFCVFYRFVAVFLLTAIMNQYRIKKVGLEEQFIAAYGGLRGAVSFSLVNMLDESLGPRQIFITATLAIILVTIFIQGTTVKPLVALLQIRKANTGKKSLSEEISDTTMDHIMAGIEEIVGQHGDFYLRELLVHYNDRYLRKWFLRSTCDSKLTRLFEKIAISEHYAHLYGPVAMIEDHVKPFYPPLHDHHTHHTPSYPTPLKDDPLPHQEFPLKNDTYEKVEDVIAESPEPGVQTRKKYPIMQIRPTRVSSSEMMRATSTPQQDATILRKAFRSNPYNKLHYKFNRHLLGEEDEGLTDHLNRRHLNARRFTHHASSMRRPTPRHRTTSEGSGLPGGVAELVERHNIRRQSMLQQRSQGTRRPLQASFSSPEPGTWSPASPGILRALHEISEQDPNGASPPMDTSASPQSPQTPMSSPGDQQTLPWKWGDQERDRDGDTGTRRREDREDVEAGVAEEEVPLVDMHGAGQGIDLTKRHTQDKQV